VAAGRDRVDRVELAHDAKARRVDVDQEHAGADVAPARIEGARHDDVKRRAGHPGDEPLAAVDDKAVAVGARRGLQQRRIGAGAVVGLGHREHGADRAGDERAQPAFLLRLGRDLVQKVRVAFVGSLDVERQRPEQAVPRSLEHHCHAAMVEAEAAPLDRRVRREQPSGASAGDELEPQGVARTVRILAPIAFARNDFVADERGHAVAQLGVLGRQREIDHGNAPVVLGR
jgi:hypothetical protein